MAKIGIAQLAMRMNVKSFNILTDSFIGLFKEILSVFFSPSDCLGFGLMAVTYVPASKVSRVSIQKIGRIGLCYLKDKVFFSIIRLPLMPQSPALHPH
jgi:hypothetical protein